MRKFLVMLQTLSFLMVELRMNAIRINLKFYRLPKMRYARFLPVLYLGASKFLTVKVGSRNNCEPFLTDLNKISIYLLLRNKNMLLILMFVWWDPGRVGPTVVILTHYVHGYMAICRKQESDKNGE